MKFLIDAHSSRVEHCVSTWPTVTLGQLVTPLTGFRLADEVPFAIDNGAYSQLDVARFKAILQRDKQHRARCLFVAVPDVVGSHRRTFGQWLELNHLADGWRKAFVAQDGFTDWPHGCDALFIGGQRGSRIQ